MGWLSSIGSAISSVGRAIGGALSSVGGAIGRVFGAAGGMLGAIGTKALGLFGSLSAIVAGPLGPILGPVIIQIVIEVAARTIGKIAHKLGIIDKDEKVEEVGYRMEAAALHEEWKTPEDFANMRDYYRYLKEMIPDEELDQQKIRENRLYYLGVGTAALTQGLEKQVEIVLPEDFVVEIGRNDMREAEIRAVIQAFKSLGRVSVDLHQFLRGVLPGKDLESITKALVDSYQKIYPEQTEEAVFERINEWRRNSRDDSYMAEKVHGDRYMDYKKQADRGIAYQDIKVLE